MPRISPQKAGAIARQRRAAQKPSEKVELTVPALPGNASLCTEDVRDTIIQAVRAGAYPATAAQRAGIQPRTFRTWMERARESEEPFASFMDKIEAAIAEDEYRNVLIVSAAAKHDAKHAEWLLERRHPDKYGRSDRVEFDGSMEARSVAVSVTGSQADTSTKYIAEVVAIALSLQARTGTVIRDDKVIDMPAPSPTVVVQDGDA